MERMQENNKTIVTPVAEQYCYFQFQFFLFG